MKKKVMAVFAMGWCSAVFADSYILNKTGAWNTLDSWVVGSAVPTRLPDTTDSASVTFGRTVTIDSSYAALCSSCTIAYGAGESGTIRLNSGSFFSQGVLNVGRGGNGFFYQAADTTNTFASSYLCLGEQKSGNGYYELNGGFLGGAGTGTKDMYIGYNGTGVFHQVGGELGYIGTDRYLYLANVAGSDGTYVQDGGKLLFTNKTWMTVGNYGTARFLQTNGSVKVALAEVYVGRKLGGVGLYRTVGGTSAFGTIKFGDEAGSFGTLEAFGGTLTADYIYAGLNGTGSVLQTSGSIGAGTTLYIGREATSRGFYRIDGGLTQCGMLIMADKTGAAGTLALNGGRIGVTNNFNGGYVGSASIAQTGGVLESLPKASGDSYWYVGNVASSTGRYAMVGGEIDWTNANNHAYIGEYGRGELYQTNGAFRVRNWLTVSRRSGSSGFYRIAGGRLEVNDTLQLSQEAGSSSVFEICGTNAAISCRNFTAWTNNLWRAKIVAGGLSPVNVTSATSLNGVLEVSVPYANYKTQTVLVNCGSGGTTLNFSQVRAVPPLMKVSVAQVGSQVVLKNFQYVGTRLVVW